MRFSANGTFRIGDILGTRRLPFRHPQGGSGNYELCGIAVSTALLEQVLYVLYLEGTAERCRFPLCRNLISAAQSKVHIRTFTCEIRG